VDHDGRSGPLDAQKIADHRAKDPDTFLSRLAIIGEGITEVGFCAAFLEWALDAPLQQYGIHLSDGNGNDNTVLLLEALAEGGLEVGSFADDESKHAGRWAKIIAAQGPLVFRWKSGCLEQNVIGAVPDEKLEALLLCPEGKRTGPRLRILAERLNINDKDLDSIKAAAAGNLRQLIVEAAIGAVPPDKTGEKDHYKSHSQTWSRRLPMTQRLTSALKATRHLRSERVVCSPDGTPSTRDQVIKAIRGAQRVAGLPNAGVHVLRHTFCSHLAMKGAPARDPGAGRSRGSHDDAALHALESRGDRRRDSLVGCAKWRSEPRTNWRHSGHPIAEIWKCLMGKDLVERATGIEPVSEAWEASVLPLY
jgi:hypothetical protein